MGFNYSSKILQINPIIPATTTQHTKQTNEQYSNVNQSESGRISPLVSREATTEIVCVPIEKNATFYFNSA